MAAKKTQTEKIEYYRAWRGMEIPPSQSYDEIKETFVKVNQVRQKEGLKVFSLSKFEYKEEAEAFGKGELDKYIRDKHKPLEAVQYDAVIYADGSFDNEKMASYGLIIFFKDEADPYIESGTLEDVDVTEYKIVKYDRFGNEIKDGDSIRKNDGIPEAGDSEEGKGFVSSSRQIPGEFFGVMRALEICCQTRGLKKLSIIHDCNVIKDGYEARNNLKDASGYAAVAYRKFFQNFEDVDPQFTQVYSHSSNSNKKKHQYPIDANINNADKYLHAVYNDLVDILAKAETEIELDEEENFNAFRMISDEFEKFPKAATAEERRKHARKLVNAVLKKSDGIYRPIFSKE